MEKLCVFCIHHAIDYDPGDSCPTCGYDASASMRCAKNHWELGIGRLTTTEDYREVILKANTCRDYKQAAAPQE